MAFLIALMVIGAIGSFIGRRMWMKGDPER